MTVLPISAPGSVSMHGIDLENATLPEAVTRITRSVRTRTRLRIAFVNADCVNIAVRDPAYLDALQRADVCWADGIGVRIAARLRGHRLRDNVNGTDLFPLMMTSLETVQARIFLLGGEPGVATSVAEIIHERWPGVRVVGARHGFFSASEAASVARDVRASRADVLLTAMGAPRQEIFNDLHHPMMGVSVVAGVGGLFNFVSGRISRAPAWMRAAGLEWVHRLLMEPRRLWRRYLVGNVRFLARELAVSRSVAPPATASASPRRAA